MAHTEKNMKPQNNTIIRVGLAGYGMSGKMFQAPFLDADPRFQLAKVYERSSQRSKEDYPYVQVVSSFQELLTEDIDLVVISTPNPLHYPMALEALQAGKHVVVEKPVAATHEEAESLNSLALEKGLLLSVYQNRRFDGDYLTVKKLIQEETLGELLDYQVHFDRYVKGASSKKWKAEGGAGINTLYDIGVHIIDQAYALFGMPQEVYADFRKLREETSGIDNFQVILYYGQLKVSLSAGEIVAGNGPHFILNGRKGSYIKYYYDIQERNLSSGASPAAPDWGVEPPERYGRLYLDQESGITESILPTETGHYGCYYDQIYKSFTQKAPLPVTCQQAADVLRIIQAAEQSNSEKGRISMNV